MALWSSLTRRRILLVDAVRTRLWPVPLMAVVVSIAAGILLPQADAALNGSLPPTVSDVLFGGGPSAAREVLSTIASSLVTVTSLTFSLTVVTLQLASSQFSPRLLRTFARDRFVQRTLALFLATFAYALTVLRSIRDENARSAAFVPEVSVTIAYLLALASVVGLVFFLAHLVREIRVEAMINTVRADAVATASGLFRELDSDDNKSTPLPQPPPSASMIAAAASGFLVAVDEEALLNAAVRADAVILLDRKPGEYLVVGTPVAFAWANDTGAALDDDALADLRSSVDAAVNTGDERTPVQDVGYGLRQLTDVAVKALSPGINDPTTAIHVLGHSSTLLCELAGRHVGPSVRCDDDQVARVVIRRPGLPELLDLAISQPRHYGASDALLMQRLYVLLREVAWRASDPGDKEAVAEELERTRRAAARQDFDAAERDELARQAGLVRAALAGQWRPQPLNG